MSKQAGLGLIIAFTIIAYASTWRAAFVYEDVRAVLSNGEVQQQQPWHLHELRSLSVLSFRLNHAVDGNNPRGYHAVNVAVHIVNTLLFYVIASALLETDWAVLLACAIFALSPLQSESVAYITGRTELLAGCAVLGAVALALQPARWWHLLAIPGILLAGLLTKETALVGWFLVPLVYLFQYHRQLTRRAVSRPGLLAACFVCGVMAGTAIWILRPLQHLDMGFIGSERGYLSYAAIQASAFWRYVFELIVPYGFTIDHDYDLISHLLAYLALATLPLLAWIAWRIRRTDPLTAFGIVWILIALAPRILVRIPEYLNEHQMYVAMVGLSLIFGTWLDRVASFDPLAFLNAPAGNDAFLDADTR